MAQVVGKWEGGRIKQTSDGRRVFYIRKRLGGRIIERSTGATSRHAAMEQWRRFQANPAVWTPGGAPQGEVLSLREHLDSYIDYCTEKGNSQNWRYQKRRYLEWWRDALPGDCRLWTRARVLSAMEGQAVKHNALAALKAWASWLRNVRGSLTKAEDVTVDIAIPALKPAQWRGAPRAIPREVFDATLAKLGEPWHTICEVLGATGMHTTECLRLARGHGGMIGGALEILHKSGRRHRMQVAPETAQAVERMQRRGGFSVSRLMHAVAAACVKAKVERWAPGALRHSAATWLIADGAPLERVAAYLNHDLETLKRFYSAAVIPRPERPEPPPSARR